MSGKRAKIIRRDVVEHLSHERRDWQRVFRNAYRRAKREWTRRP